MREELGKARLMSEFWSIASEFKELRKGESPESKLGWYMRHIPKEHLDSYNDYRISLSKKMIVEESNAEKVAITTDVQENASLCLE